MNRENGMFGKLTDGALPKEVSLTFSGSVAWELPIDFVFDAAHGYECSDNTNPTAGFHWEKRVRREGGKPSEHTSSSDFAIMDIAGGREQTTTTLLSKGESNGRLSI